MTEEKECFNFTSIVIRHLKENNSEIPYKGQHLITKDLFCTEFQP